MSEGDYIIDRNDPILITGANGFIGSRVVEVLPRYGFKTLEFGYEVPDKVFSSCSC